MDLSVNETNPELNVNSIHDVSGYIVHLTVVPLTRKHGKDLLQKMRFLIIEKSEEGS